MRFSEKILLRLSRVPESKDYEASLQRWDIDNALSLLCREYPNFKGAIRGKTILDFGCGNGYQVVAMGKAGAKHVFGLDSNPAVLERAEAFARANGLNGNVVEFGTRLETSVHCGFDIIISQNSMEHYKDPSGILNQMKKYLKPSGKIIISFGPPWFSPYGSHMHFFTRLPWVNLFFSEDTVMKVRLHYRRDGATRYEDVESGLNKMSLRKFEGILSSCGMHVLYKQYSCVKNINLFGKVPLIRELFVNHVTCVLSVHDDT